MIAINLKNKLIYEGGKIFISSVVGVHRNTLSNWEKKGNRIELYNNFEVIFDNVIRK